MFGLIFLLMKVFQDVVLDCYAVYLFRLSKFWRACEGFRFVFRDEVFWRRVSRFNGRFGFELGMAILWNGLSNNVFLRYLR